MSEEEKTLKARPVALCDNVINIITGGVSQFIFAHYKYLPVSELFIGKSLKPQDVSSLSTLMKCGHGKYMYLSPDWSAFDNHAYEELIVTAFFILKNCFSRAKATRGVFFFLITSFLDKFILIDPGFIIKLTKGIPSGHPFTTLVGSLVN